MRLTCQLSRRFNALATLVPLFVLVFIAGLPARSIAQDQSTATIKVYAFAADAAGVRPRVEIASLDDAWVVRSGTAGPTVPAEVRLLPIGRYRVSVSQDGYAPASLELGVDPGEMIWVRASLRRAAEGAVTSEIVVVDRWHAGEAVVMRELELGGMPASAHMWTLIDALVPWTLVDGIDHGGSESGRRGLFGVRDGSWTWNAFVVDGIDLTDPDRTGGPLMFLDPRAMQAVTVTSGLAPAAVASPGGQVTFVPRRPAATRRGSLELMGTTRGMVGNRDSIVAPYITKMHSWGDANAQFSTPITDRVSAFLSARLTHSNYVERGAEATRPANAASLFTHVVARPTAMDEVRIVASAARTTRGLEGGDAFLGRRVTERNTFAHAQAAWNRVFPTGTTASAALGFSRGVFSPDLTDPVGGGVVDRVYDGPVPSPIALRRTRRADFTAGMTLPVQTFGRSWHTWRLDASVTSARSTSQILAAPHVAEMVGGVPARVWQFEVPAADPVRRLTQIGISAADDMRLGDNFAADWGIRVDRWSGRAAGAPAGVNTVTFSPRLAARAYFPSYGLGVYGAIGRYHARLPLEWLAFGDADQSWARLYRWTDPNGDRRFDPAERGAQVALAGWGAPIGSIDPDLRLPATNEYVLGGEVRLKSAVVRATATIRHEMSLVRSVNIGIPLSSYTQTLIPDQTDDRLMIPVYNRPPGSADLDRYVLTNPTENGLKYHALEVVYEQPITPRFRLRASALEWWTFGPAGAPGFHVFENDQGLVGELFQDPNTLSHAKGANFFDRSYVAKVSGSYLAPRDFFVSFSANYRDGQAFAGLIVVPDLVQGPEPIQSYRRGRTRFTFTLLLDTRIEKRMMMGKRQAAFWLDIFNLPGMYEEVEEDPVPGPLFRRSTALQPPRTFRAGFRVGF